MCDHNWHSSCMSSQPSTRNPESQGVYKCWVISTNSLWVQYQSLILLSFSTQIWFKHASKPRDRINGPNASPAAKPPGFQAHPLTTSSSSTCIYLALKRKCWRHTGTPGIETSSRPHISGCLTSGSIPHPPSGSHYCAEVLHAEQRPARSLREADLVFVTCSWRRNGSGLAVTAERDGNGILGVTSK